MNTYTIGHSNHKWETFAGLLKRHGVELLVDTRSKPVSRFAPFSNIRLLPDLLDGEGIDYAFMGDSLGGKPDDPSCYDADGKPDYKRMRSKDEFQDGMRQLVRMAENSVTAIMCSEEDPGKCHRHLLIGPALEEHGVRSLHIRKDGVAHDIIGLPEKIRRQTPEQAALPLEQVNITYGLSSSNPEPGAGPQALE